MISPEGFSCSAFSLATFSCSAFSLATFSCLFLLQPPSYVVSPTCIGSAKYSIQYCGHFLTVFDKLTIVTQYLHFWPFAQYIDQFWLILTIWTSSVNFGIDKKNQFETLTTIHNNLCVDVHIVKYKSCPIQFLCTKHSERISVPSLCVCTLYTVHGTNIHVSGWNLCTTIKSNLCTTITTNFCTICVHIHIHQSLIESTSNQPQNSTLTKLLSLSQTRDATGWNVYTKLKSFKAFYSCTSDICSKSQVVQTLRGIKLYKVVQSCTNSPRNKGPSLSITRHHCSNVIKCNQTNTNTTKSNLILKFVFLNVLWYCPRKPLSV